MQNWFKTSRLKNRPPEEAGTVPASVLRTATAPTAGGPGSAAQENEPLTVWETVLKQESDLVDFMFRKVVQKKIGLASYLQSHICPVTVDDAGKAIRIFVTPDYVGSNELAETVALCKRQGHVLSPAPQIVPISMPLLTSISKGELSPQMLNMRQTALSSPSRMALWQTFVDVVSWGCMQDAADIHFCIDDSSPRSQIRFTIGGRYVAPEMYRLPTKTLLQILGTAWMHSDGGNGAQFDPFVEQQCRIHMTLGNQKKIMLRWASLAADRGPNVTLRVQKLDGDLIKASLGELGYLPSQVAQLRNAVSTEGGAIILSGRVGSGKSSTLAVALRMIPGDRKIVTFEDPVEILHDTAVQCTITRNLAIEDDTSFMSKLRTLKRTGLHDFLLGEIRDRVTGAAFQDVVESGHSVYTTVHAGSAIGIPDRLASPFIGVDRDVLATPGVLKLLVNQELRPMLCPHCALDHRSDPSATKLGPDARKTYLDRLCDKYRLRIENLRFANPLGCRHCIKPGIPELNGYSGRTVVAEIITPDRTILTHIKHADNLALRQYLDSLEKSPFDDQDMTGKSVIECGIYKASQGILDPYDIFPPERFGIFTAGR